MLKEIEGLDMMILNKSLLFGIVCLFGYNANAINAPVIAATASANSAAAESSRRSRETSIAAQQVASADSFVTCNSTKDGRCYIVEHSGCAQNIDYFSYRDYLVMKKPEAIFVGFSYNAYEEEAYIYYKTNGAKK